MMLKRYQKTILSDLDAEEIMLLSLYGYHVYERELKNSQRASFFRESQKHKAKSKEHKEAKIQEEVCVKDMVEHRDKAEALQQAISSYRQVSLMKMVTEIKKQKSDES